MSVTLFGSETKRADHQTLAYGMERYTLDDGKITAVIQSASINREAVDTAIEVLLNAINTFPEPEVAFILYDFSALKSFTPYMREATANLMKKFYPSRHIFIGAVGGNSMVNMLVRLVVNQVVRLVRGRVQIKLFDDDAQAIKWLQQKRSTHKRTANP